MRLAISGSRSIQSEDVDVVLYALDNIGIEFSELLSGHREYGVDALARSQA